MEYEQLLEKTNRKVHLKGVSNTGKTFTASKVVVNCLRAGMEVCVGDLEDSVVKTIVNIIESNDVDKEVVGNLEMVEVESFDDLIELTERGQEFDLVVFDPLDHKHSLAAEHSLDVKTEADIEWNEYHLVYSWEKEVMKRINKMECNVITTIDPESGSSDKDKGVQANIHGYHDIVISLILNGDEHTNKVRKWLGKEDISGSPVGNLTEGLSKQIIQRTDKEIPEELL